MPEAGGQPIPWQTTWIYSHYNINVLMVYRGGRESTIKDLFIDHSPHICAATFRMHGNSLEAQTCGANEAPYHSKFRILAGAINNSHFEF
jgi:hypothetical protein